MKTSVLTFYVPAVVLFCAAAWPAATVAQQQGPDEAYTQPPPADGDQPPRVDYDSEPPYTAYERYWNRRFPAPYRRAFREEYYPYGRPYYPRRYQSRYAGDCGYWAAYPYDGLDSFGTEAFDEGYIGGFDDGRRFQKWQTQVELGLNSYLKAMQQGAAHFRNGDYGTAARQFILAAKLNQGDPASRLHAVHALTALGHYTAAVPALRRALQLQPRLVYLPLDIRSEYGRVDDFAVHLRKLAEAAESEPDDAGLWLLLGYYQFFSGSAADAAGSLRRAVELAPDDPTCRRLHDAARFSVPADETAPKPTAPEPAAESV